MRIGVPKEIKADEYRVGLIPEVVSELVAAGHDVLVETSAGFGSGISDDDYTRVGAVIVANSEQVFERGEMIVKVKEPLPPERKKLRRGQIVFCYLHLAADPQQAKDLVSSGVSAVAYETVTGAQGVLPLLAPMSAVAGRMVPQIASHFLEKPHGGRGILLGGMEGLPPANILILGSGVVGTQAALAAARIGAEVTVVAHSSDSAHRASAILAGQARIVVATREEITALCARSDVMVGAALRAGGAAPKLVSAAAVKAMRTGAVIIDVSIDQGGCFETSRPTTHSNPAYAVDGVIHYCVTNMPAAVPRTSSFALNRATAPFVKAIADQGLRDAMRSDIHLRNGLNVYEGQIVCRAVAEALALRYVGASEAIGAST
jgi:alanine dehydrogenase